MLKIRLQRTGRKNDPAFRMVVAENTIGAKSGKIVERVGSHHPKTKETIFDGERIKYWMSVGAKASDRVHNMLISEGIIEGKKVNVLPKKTPQVEASREEGPKEEVAAEATEEGGEEAATETAEESPAASSAESKEDITDDKMSSEEVAEVSIEKDKKRTPTDEEKKED
jgi:small subunit ribosomal protein S16